MSTDQGISRLQNDPAELVAAGNPRRRSGEHCARPRREGARAAGVLARWALGLLIAGLFLLPIAYMAALSLKSPDQVLSTLFLPQRPAFENWPAVFRQANLLLFLGNSVAASVTSAAATLIITVPAVYAVYRRGIARRWLPGLTLGCYVAPPVVSLIPMYFFLKSTNLLHTLPGLILTYAVAHVPVAFWLLSGFIHRIPREIDEAAAIDGAGPWTTLRRLIIPLLGPGLAAAGIICAILAYNEFLFAFFFTAGPTRTMPIAIALFQGERLVNFGQMAAASLVGIFPVYVAALACQRWLVSGLTAGADR